MAREELRRQLLTGMGNTPASQSGMAQDGYPPTEIDATMDAYISSLLTADPALSCTYVSEENQKNYYAKPGKIFAWCDPLDGTTNSFTAFSGYAIVLFFDIFLNDRFEHLAGAIAAADGTIVSWHHFDGKGEVWIDWPSDFRWPSLSGQARSDFEDSYSIDKEVAYSAQIYQPRPGDTSATTKRLPLHAGVKRRMAAVASSPGRRNEILATFDLDTGDAPGGERLWLSTLAGNPVVAPLLMGDLSVVIEPHAVKLHDAAYLIPLHLLGGHIVDFDGRPIPVMEMFAETEQAKRRIGPFVAASSPAAKDELLSRRRRGEGSN